MIPIKLPNLRACLDASPAYSSIVVSSLSEYFLILTPVGNAIFTHVPSFQEEPLTLGVASTPALVLRRVAPAPGPVLGSLLHPVSSIPLSFRRETLRPSAVSSILRSPAVIPILLLYSSLYKNDADSGSQA